MMNGLEGFDAHWVWIAIGLILAALEMLVPGVYLIWLAIAAIITGLLTLGIDLALPAQVVVFVSLSLIAAFSVSCAIPRTKARTRCSISAAHV